MQEFYSRCSNLFFCFYFVHYEPHFKGSSVVQTEGACLGPGKSQHQTPKAVLHTFSPRMSGRLLSETRTYDSVSERWHGLFNHSNTEVISFCLCIHIHIFGLCIMILTSLLQSRLSKYIFQTSASILIGARTVSSKISQT